MKQPTLILVTGQHRSGTSAVAGCLDQLGVYLGHHLMPGNEANPKGYFEDIRAVQLHDELLAALGASWDRPECVPGNWRDRPEADVLVARLVGLLYEFSLGYRYFAIKDPRACLFMPAWQEACHKADVRLTLLTPRRLEVSAARSLVRREGWSYSRAAEVVLGYRRALEHLDPGIPHATIDFPDGLWQASAWERVGRELAIPLPVGTCIDAVHAFLDFDLVHHG